MPDVDAVAEADRDLIGMIMTDRRPIKPKCEGRIAGPAHAADAA